VNSQPSKGGGCGGQVRSACLLQAGRMTSGHRSRPKRVSLLSGGGLLIFSFYMEIPGASQWR